MEDQHGFHLMGLMAFGSIFMVLGLWDQLQVLVNHMDGFFHKGTPSLTVQKMFQFGTFMVEMMVG